MVHSMQVHALQLAQEGLLRVRVFPPDPNNVFRWSAVASFKYTVDVDRLLRQLRIAKFHGMYLLCLSCLSCKWFYVGEGSQAKCLLRGRKASPLPLTLNSISISGMTLDAVEYVPPVRKRVLQVSGIAADRSVLLRDVQLAKSLVQYLDTKHDLWQCQKETQEVEAGELDEVG